MKDKKKYVVLVVLASFCMVAFGCGKGSEAGENKIEAYYQEVKDSDVSYENGVCYVNSQILLTAEKGVSEKAIRRLVKKQGGNIVGYISISNDYQIEFEDEKTYDQICKIIEEWKDNSQIADVSLNYAVRNETDSIDYTKDPWIDDKNAKDTSGSVWSESEPDGNNWWAEAIWMPSVWEMDVEFSPVKVGIYDTMFDVDNDDLDEAFVKLWNNPENASGNCAVSTLYDNESEISNYSHGTHVAGIIAADAENDFGIAGVSQNAELYGYSFASESEDHETTGRWGDVFEVKYVTALMLNEGVKVINFSIGWEELLVAAQHGVPTALETLQYASSSYESFLKDCLEAGYDFLIVKSAGNENGNNWIPCEASEEHPYGYMKDPTAKDDMVYDAKYDVFGAIEDETVKSHILIVGAVENHVDYYKTAYFSTEGERVDVYAPGVNILSTLPSDQIGMKSGTSMAAPIVTGIVSLVWGINPDLSAEQVADIVQASVNISAFDSESVSNLFHKVETTPIVNAYFAVQLAADTTGNGESANSAGIITGMAYRKDVDDNLVQMENVNVTIIDSAGNIVDTCVTSSLNGYDFILPTGTYTIQAELEDYETKRKEVTLESGSVFNVDFEMERSIEELSVYIQDFEQMYSVVGGNSASERGDHEEWMIGPDIQYGNYIGSSSVDEILLNSERYSLFDIYVGQTVDEMKRNMLENGWDLQETSESVLEYKKEKMNLQCDIQKGCVSLIGFWRDMMSEKLPDDASPDEDEEKMAIEIAKQKYGDEFSYFCTEKFIYQGKEFLVVDVKTHVDDHLTRVTQVLIAKDGSYVGEGFYSANPENIEFYE